MKAKFLRTYIHIGSHSEYVNKAPLPVTNRSRDFHCVLEKTLALDHNYISIRAVVDGAEKGKNGYVSIIFDRATEAFEKCNVNNPSMFLTFDALSWDNTINYNTVIFMWSFDNSSSWPTRTLHLAASTKDEKRPFSSTSTNLKYLQKQEIRFNHDSIEVGNKMSSLKSPECNFVPTIDNNTIFQLFIEFYVPQILVNCRAQLLFPIGFVKTEEKFNNNYTNPVWHTSELDESVVVNVSQGAFGGAFGSDNGVNSSLLGAYSFIMLITTFVSIILAIYL